MCYACETHGHICQNHHFHMSKWVYPMLLDLFGFFWPFSKFSKNPWWIKIRNFTSWTNWTVWIANVGPNFIRKISLWMRKTMELVLAPFAKRDVNHFHIYIGKKTMAQMALFTHPMHNCSNKRETCNNYTCKSFTYVNERKQTTLGELRK